MKMYELYQSEYVKNSPKLQEKLRDLIEEQYPHLRYTLRGNIYVDTFLIDKIISLILDNCKYKEQIDRFTIDSSLPVDYYRNKKYDEDENID